MLFLLTLLALPLAHADSIEFTCQNLAPPRQQGDERFVKIAFVGGQATLEIADLTSPVLNVGALLTSEGASYSDTSTSAPAGWKNEQGNVVTISLVYLGSWWGANLRFNQALAAPGLSFSAGEELDLRCNEK